MQSLRTSHSIQVKGNLVSLESPIVMGIVNLTPDSFYAGSRVDADADFACAMAERMFNDGATLVDLGGQSSRPGAELLSEEEELKRVIPTIELISSRFPDAVLSIDTFYAKVAKEAVEAGAAMVNDISAGSIDPKMFETVADLHVPYVLMHMKGKPKDMQTAPAYKNVTQEVMHFFTERLNELKKLGVIDVILDPGFGFGKTQEHNFELLNNLELLAPTDRPILAGLSRKSMIYKYLNINSEEALNGTTALHMAALQAGAKILRVHDVKEAVETVKLYQALQS